MSDLTIEQVRQKFPQYNDLTDDQLAHGLHDKYYSDMSFDDFSKKIGYSQKQSVGGKILGVAEDVASLGAKTAVTSAAGVAKTATDIGAVLSGEPINNSLHQKIQGLENQVNEHLGPGKAGQKLNKDVVDTLGQYKAVKYLVEQYGEKSKEVSAYLDKHPNVKDAMTLVSDAAEIAPVRPELKAAKEAGKAVKAAAPVVAKAADKATGAAVGAAMGASVGGLTGHAAYYIPLAGHVLGPVATFAGGTYGAFKGAVKGYKAGTVGIVKDAVAQAKQIIEKHNGKIDKIAQDADTKIKQVTGTPTKRKAEVKEIKAAAESKMAKLKKMNQAKVDAVLDKHQVS